MKKLIVLLALLASCSGPKAYTARSMQKSSKSGVHSLAKIQADHNFESVMKRNDPDRKFLFVFPYPEFLR